jgi:TPP-dependent pyruvate/acetoin dehydrogenase alpha subunit
MTAPSATWTNMAVHTEKKNPAQADVSSTTRLDWYRQMCRIRAFERAVYGLSKAGLIAGTAHLYIGMEAIAVGSCSAMRDGDLVTSTHRGHGHAIACGLNLGRMMAEILGRADGYCRGKGGSMHITDISRGMLGADGIVGGGIPIAVGAALGLRLKGSSSVVFCFFGEGAANQGTFHEALNLAAVNHLPVLFICENNLWALSASSEEVTAGSGVANRAAAYGMPGYKVDGNDVEAVFQTVSASAARATDGAGPCLIECLSYRWESHSIIPRQEIRPEQEIDDWKQKDPIRLYGELLLASKLATAEALGRIDSETTAEAARAVAFAKGSPTPDLESAFQDIYV